MECGQYVRKCSKQTVTSVKDLTLMIPEVSVSPNIDQTKIVNLTNSQIKGLWEWIYEIMHISVIHEN